MESFNCVLLLWMCAALSQLCLSQRIIFKEPVKFHTSLKPDGQSRNWSLVGDVELTNPDLILLEPKLSIQTCHQVCTVDLMSCSSVNDLSDSSQEACVCESKVADVHRIHIKSKAQMFQSEAKIVATIPSRVMFQPIAASSVIGTLPVISEDTATIEATYQVNEGPAQKLNLLQKIFVCPNKFVIIKVCVPERNPGTVLEINAHDGQSMISHESCVQLPKKFSSNTVVSNKLSVSYFDQERSMMNGIVSNILLQENKECNPSPTAPVTVLTTTPATQTDSLLVLSKALSTLTDIISSLKVHSDGTTIVLNKTVTQLSNIVNNQKKMTSLIQLANGSHEVSMNNLSTQIYNSFTSLQQHFDDINNNIDSLKDDVMRAKAINLCSKGNGCEVNPGAGCSYRCYQVVKDDLVNWYEAGKKCTALGGFLAEVQDSQSLDYINRIVAPKKSSPALWIGGTDEGQEGVWTWATSGKNFSISNWGNNEPNDLGGSENCLHIGHHFLDSHDWNDNACIIKLGYICEKDGDSCNGWM